MVDLIPGQQSDQELETQMYPVGTEVIYKEHRGVIVFVDPATGTCSICIKEFPNQPSRQVRLVVSIHDMEHIVPVIGNHSRS